LQQEIKITNKIGIRTTGALFPSREPMNASEAHRYR